MAPNIVYKTLWFIWLNQAFCPALADRMEPINQQFFIRVTVIGNY